LIERLEEQKVLLKNPSFLRTTTRLVGKGDARHSVERTQRVRPWWRNDAAGNFVMTVLHASRPVELAPGKTGILTSKDKLPALIDQLIAAAKAREFDDILSKAVKPFPRRKAARQHLRWPFFLFGFQIFFVWIPKFFIWTTAASSSASATSSAKLAL
jgi:hypothetical protein